MIETLTRRPSVRITGDVFDIAVFDPDKAPTYGAEQWSLAQLRSSADAVEKPAFAMAVARAMDTIGVTQAFAPAVADMSGRVVAREKLSPIDLPGGKVLWRNPTEPADAVELRHTGEAFLMSSAGCAVIIAHAGPHLFVAHAGRDSLIDRKAVMGEIPREHEGVVSALVATFKARGIDSSDVTMLFALAIPAHEFKHHFEVERFGPFNKNLEIYGRTRWPHAMREGRDGQGYLMYLSLEHVFLSQAKALGVKNASTAHSLALYPGLAHTRDGKGTRRNLVFVKRR